MEERPFVIGESVYLVDSFQEPGTVCAETRIWRDDGGEWVETVSGPVRASAIRRDRRGRKLPAYPERPLTAAERKEIGQRGA